MVPGRQRRGGGDVGQVREVDGLLSAGVNRKRQHEEPQNHFLHFRPRGRSLLSGLEHGESAGFS